MNAAAYRPSISAHRLVADGHSMLLVRPDGEIDWWCAPEPDSPPLCWSLLDPLGGRAAFCGVRYARCSPEPAGPTAWTLLSTASGRVAVRDGLVTPPGCGTALVRQVRGLDVDLDIEHELRLTEFGGGECRWDARHGSARTRVNGCGVSVEGGRATVSDGVLRSRLAAPVGEWATLVMTVGEERPPDDGVGAAGAARYSAALDQAERDHASWLGRCRAPRSHPDRALDAMRVLRACTYSPTGAVVAAVTLGLPEAPGHDRQFDYRYSWLRDACLALSVASLLGQGRDGERYLAFVRSITTERLVPSGPLVDVRGNEPPEAHNVAGVAGWAGSQPIRVGNDAKNQVQYDALGLLVEAISVHVQTGGRLDGDTWRMVRELADRVAEEDPAAPRMSHGIWEMQKPALLVDGDIGRWLTLDRAITVGRVLRPFTSLRGRCGWAARNVIASRVREALLPDGGLPQAYGQHPPRPDAAALMAVVFGLLDPSQEPARRLVRRTIEQLEAEPFLYRYPPDETDGFSGTEGAFVPVSFWAVTALAQIGDLAGATRRLDALCARLPRLLSEEVDPLSSTALGNVPLLWSHAELARCLYVLDAARLRARWGTVGLTAWRLMRYLRLRFR